MHTFLAYAILFIMGSMIGWIIELVFRRVFSAKKWINPGFLNGPYLPLYGFGTAFMYGICSIPIAWYWITIIIAVVMTLIEYIAGIIFIKGMHIKLWDYSKRWGNIQGIICPLFSFMWAVVGVGFQFLIYPLLVKFVAITDGNIAVTFVLGLLYGVFFVDLGLSLHLATKIRTVAKELKETVVYEKVKAFIATNEKVHQAKRSFIFPFKSVKSIKENIQLSIAKHIEEEHKQIENTNESAETVQPEEAEK